MHNPYIITALLFVLGTLFGSFASAITHRIHTNDASFFTGRSKCPHCQKTLGVLNLIPLASYLWQRGKAHCCQKKIGQWYFWSELCLGILFTLPYLIWLTGNYASNTNNLSLTFASTYLLIFTIHLIVIYDARFKLIPDIYSYAFILFGATTGFLLGLDWQLQLLGAVIGGGFFGIQYLISKGTWIGDGDILLGIGMGLLLGPKLILSALFMAYISGSLIGVLLISLGKVNRKSTIAFGPFLLFGTLVGLFYGAEIINWYLSLISF